MDIGLNRDVVLNLRKKACLNIGRHFWDLLNTFSPNQRNTFGEITIFVSFMYSPPESNKVKEILEAVTDISDTEDTNYSLSYTGGDVNVKEFNEKDYERTDDEVIITYLGGDESECLKYKIAFVMRKNTTLLKMLILNFYDKVPISIRDVLICAIDEIDVNRFDYNSIIDQAMRSYISLFSIDVNLLIHLSSQKYEGENTCSRIIKSSNSALDMQATITLSEPIEFTMENMRGIRKLAEITRNHIAMLIDNDNKVIGFTTPHPENNVCLIHITGHLSFSFSNDDVCIRYSNGVYRIVESVKTEYYLQNYIGFGHEYFENVIKVIDYAKNQKHGTVLIFGNAKDITGEVKRLSAYNRGIEIDPYNLLSNMKLIENISSIDGALMIDEHCFCHGIGFILDGDAVISGLKSRGARYNSTVNYIRRKRENDIRLLGVIISEDETIDIYL